MLDAILWVLGVGAPWRDLPGQFGKWTTVYNRFRRWQRACAQHRGVVAVSPRCSSEPPDPFFDREAYRERNQVERLIGRLKQHRRIAPRYE